MGPVPDDRNRPLPAVIAGLRVLGLASGWLADPLALLSRAGHRLTDAAATVTAGENCHRIQVRLKAMPAERFEIVHPTTQVDHS